MDKIVVVINLSPQQLVTVVDCIEVAQSEGVLVSEELMAYFRSKLETERRYGTV